MSKQRETFEVWAKDEGYNINRVDERPHLYNWASTQCCWDAWQASRAATLEEAAETCRSMGIQYQSVHMHSCEHAIRALKKQS